MKQTKLKYSRKLAHKIRDIIRSTKNKISVTKFRVANKFRKVQNAKIHVGCGTVNLHGYINSDIRNLANVHLVCKAWELDRFAENAAEIYSRHMIEHLTLHEMMTTVRIWYKCLRPGGKIILLCPDMDFHVQQYLNAKWTDEEWDNHFKDSNAKWSFAGFWGHQRGTEDIFQRTSNPNLYWDVHKSGYNKMSMLFFLKRALPEGYIAETKTIPLRDGVGLHLETVITKT